MGRLANEYAKFIYITSDNPRNEDPDEIAQNIISGISSKNNVILELNRKIAIKYAIDKSKDYKNPVILILGKGDETEQIIYDKKFPLNDKKIVQELLIV